MQGTIFKNPSLDRAITKWEDMLYEPTPVQSIEHEGKTMMFKRGDYFAPLGYGGINGDKLRVAIWLMLEHLKNGGSPDIVHGTVVGSPQSPMATAVSRHFGGETITVLGATKPKTAIKHGMVEMSAWFGSKFDFVGSGYNSTIQPRCKKIVIENKPNAFYLEYGITTDHKIETNTAERIRDFHSVGAHQVANIPDTVKDLIIPAGSCNCTMSVLLGLAMYPKPNLERVHLVGIGPNRIKWIETRLKMIQETDPVTYKNLLNFKKNYTHNKDLEKATRSNALWEDIIETPKNSEPAFELVHYDLHTTNWVRYHDLIPNGWGNIELHPRYEGKVLEYMKKQLPHLIKEDSLFWIVGSKPSIEPMKQYCPELGEVPESIEVAYPEAS